MDTIEFVLEDTVIEAALIAAPFPTVNIYINGTNLLVLVGQVERAHFYPGEANPPKSQSYIGFDPAYHRGFIKEFLGLTVRPISALLVCTCFEEMCNSIVAKITFNTETVTWSNIRSPFLSGEAGKWMDLDAVDIPKEEWVDYSSLGPFVFDRRQYLEALSAVE